MKSPAASIPELDHSRDFSLVLGGPLFQLLRRGHLAGEAMELVQRRIIAIVLIAWAPLLVLSAIAGHLLPRSVSVPFLLDLETHIRFLVVVPLLLISELVVHTRLLRIVRTFLDRRLIPEQELARFDDAVRSAFRLRDSLLAEILMIAFVYVVGVVFVWRQYTAPDADTWYGTTHGDASHLTPAGIWFVAISLPLFQFLLLRWYFRFFIWIRFLWHVSRIRLALMPTHPDNLGGLGFLSNTVYAFTVLLLAHGAMVAAQIAGRVLLLGAKLPEFKTEIGVMVGFLLLLVFFPMVLFAPQLSRTKRAGLLEYGSLAERYTREFDAKWVRGGAPRDEALLGSADVQSLADLASSFNVVSSMRTVPITRNAVVQLAAAVLAPMMPLLLTMMPLEELIKRLLGLVM